MSLLCPWLTSSFTNYRSYNLIFPSTWPTNWVLLVPRNCMAPVLVYSTKQKPPPGDGCLEIKCVLQPILWSKVNSSSCAVLIWIYITGSQWLTLSSLPVFASFLLHLCRALCRLFIQRLSGRKRSQKSTLLSSSNRSNYYSKSRFSDQKTFHGASLFANSVSDYAYKTSTAFKSLRLFYWGQRAPLLIFRPFYIAAEGTFPCDIREREWRCYIIHNKKLV
jgi:hypothetical protein